MKTILQQIKRFENQEFKEGQSFKIVLPKKEIVKNITKSEQISTRPVNELLVGKSYTITVKKYMTEKGTPSFDFMTKWNNDIPMPLVTMTGTVLKTTRGMVYMALQGKPEKTCNCMKCGRKLTNKVSMLYGIGPECGEHWNINPYDTEEELNKHLDEVYKNISNIKWTGWVIKSAIKEFKEI